MRHRLPRIRTWLWVDDGSGAVPRRGRRRTRTRRRRAGGRVAGPWGRSRRPPLLLYTGGTTGMPKGVMWRQDDLFGALDAANRKRLPPEQDLDAAADRVAKPGPAQPAGGAADARHRAVQRDAAT